MLSTCSDTFLGVDGSCELPEGGGGVGGSKEDGLVLVHSSVDEEQGSCRESKREGRKDIRSLESKESRKREVHPSGTGRDDSNGEARRLLPSLVPSCLSFPPF